jgi:predicted ABC-type ATPase
MFAGPNGSGKSTLKGIIPPTLLGVYLNPDDLQREIAERGFLDVRALGIDAQRDDILPFFSASPFLGQVGLADAAAALRFDNGKLDFTGVAVNAYFASVAADFLRRKLLDQGRSFSFETVMSSRDKVDLLTSARSLGFRTYLYYIATDDPAINLARIQARVRLGGHDVPADKVVSRYHRSLELLLDAIRASNRAYMFDNSRSGGDHTWVAEITEGHELVLRSDAMPHWFQRAVLDRIKPSV